MLRCKVPVCSCGMRVMCMENLSQKMLQKDTQIFNSHLVLRFRQTNEFILGEGSCTCICIWIFVFKSYRLIQKSDFLWVAPVYIHKIQLFLIFKLILPINTLETSLMNILKRPKFPLSWKIESWAANSDGFCAPSHKWLTENAWQVQAWSEFFFFKPPVHNTKHDLIMERLAQP